MHEILLHLTIIFHNTERNEELNRLNEDSITIKFEVEATFQNLNPHPIAASVRIKYKTTPSPFITIDIQFESDPDILQ